LANRKIAAAMERTDKQMDTVPNTKSLLVLWIQSGMSFLRL